jgi:hypothetical protein
MVLSGLCALTAATLGTGTKARAAGICAAKTQRRHPDGERLCPEFRGAKWMTENGFRHLLRGGAPH